VISGDAGAMIYRAGQTDGTQYFITASKMSATSDHKDRQTLLENLAVQTTRSVNGQLNEALDTSNQPGHDSIDFTIAIPDGPRTYAARNILIGDTLYQMRVVFMNYSPTSAHYKEFFSSFNDK
jgi:hypothetical protein